MRTYRKIGLSFALLIICTARASAATIRVDASQPGGNGTSWALAYNNLQTALANANPGDQVWLAAGTYTPGTSQSSSFPFEANVKIYAGFLGVNHPTLPDGETLLSQRDFVRNVTILSGDIGQPGLASDNSFVVVKSTGNVDLAELNGFTITGGNGGFDPGNGIGGAGIYLDASSSPTIANCVFLNNRVGLGVLGGALYSGGANPVISNCTFKGNHGGAGGAIYLDMGDSPLPTQITDCTFIQNVADDFGGDGGGALFNNRQNTGGAGNPPPAASVRLVNCEFFDNRSEGAGSGDAGGGAICNHNKQ